MNKKHPDLIEFMVKVKASFIETGKYMQLKLPLDNELFLCLTAINPENQFKDTTKKFLFKLPDLVKNVLSNEEYSIYEVEVVKYSVDNTLPVFQHPPNSDGVIVNKRVDVWWNEIRQMGKYPKLVKLVLALCSCFSGPLVEGSFNSMGDILDKR